MPSPTKVVTPYGGQLVWILPGGNKLIVHLKDKLKIRHKKRWSQVSVLLLQFPLIYICFSISSNVVMNKADNKVTDYFGTNILMANLIELNANYQRK